MFFIAYKFIAHRLGVIKILRHTKESKRFYNSKAWKDCRRSFIQSYMWRHHGLCEHCKDVPGYIVDHIKEINLNNINDPDVTLNHSNLQYLCTPCHNKKTFEKYSVVQDGLRFNSDGDLVKR